MAYPSTTITRLELSATMAEFDLALDRRGFIGARVLRPRIVGQQKADIAIIPVEQLLHNRDTLRAPQAGYSRGDFSFGKASYSTEEHGAEEILDDRELAMFSDVLDAEAVHAARAEDVVLRNYEAAVAAAVYDPAVWTGAALTTALGTAWDDQPNTTPIEDIESARQKIIDGCGLIPNALIVNRKQFFHLRNSDELIDRIKFSGKDDPKSVNAATVAACLDVDFVLVAGGTSNSATEGQAAAIGSIWSDDYAMLCRVATGGDPAEPCIGRTFIWGGDGAPGLGADGQMAVIAEEYRQETVRGSVLRARNDRDIVILYKEAAHLLSGLLTPP